MDRSFPCLCGKGKMLAEWSEHDTWPSPNRSISWSFNCHDCQAKYTFAGWRPHIVLRADAEKHAALTKASHKAKADVRTAAAKHEERWVKFVMASGTKIEMNRLVGSGSYGTFLKYASRPGWIQEQASVVSPKACLNHMKVSDPEVDALHEDATQAGKAADNFWKSIEKKHVPLH